LHKQNTRKRNDYPLKAACGSVFAGHAVFGGHQNDVSEGGFGLTWFGSADGIVFGGLSFGMTESMATQSQLREKLRKIEALFSGAGTTGERLAAEAALARVRMKLAELERREPAVELKFSMPDQWSRHLFIALCRRYGLRPYRYHRQRRTTVMVRAPRCFLDEVLWREFCDLDTDLQAYLHEVTLKVIREEVYADTSDAQEIPEALPAA